MSKTLAEMTTPELRAECKRRHLPYSGNDRKADLIAKITAPGGDDVNRDGPAAADRVERARLAQDEAKAAKAWRKAGAKGAPPATPNLDALNAENAPRKQNGAKGSPREAAAAARTPKAAKAELVFTRDGKDLPEGRGVSYQAWSCTKGVGGDVPRISTGALLAILANKGVADPNAGPWEVDLPNGVKIGARAAI